VLAKEYYLFMYERPQPFAESLSLERDEGKSASLGRPYVPRPRGAAGGPFEGVRIMSRLLEPYGCSTIIILRKLDNNKPFICVYKGRSYTLLLYTSLQ